MKQWGSDRHGPFAIAYRNKGWRRPGIMLDVAPRHWFLSGGVLGFGGGFGWAYKPESERRKFTIFTPRP